MVLVSFRPLPGFYSYKLYGLKVTRSRIRVSVPFRGSILTNLTGNTKKLYSFPFPSPSGVLFLQTLNEKTLERARKVSVPFRGSILTNTVVDFETNKNGLFPSPSGVLFLQTVHCKPYGLYYSFPSPSGVLFLQTLVKIATGSKKCFRPLPGFYSYKLIHVQEAEQL